MICSELQAAKMCWRKAGGGPKDTAPKATSAVSGRGCGSAV